MSQSHATLKEFEIAYVMPLRQWAVYMPVADLAKLDGLVRGLQKRSEMLSRQIFKTDAPPDLVEAWHRMLKEVERLIPTVLGQVERLKKEAWVGQQQVGKNQKTLQGYRTSVQHKPLLLDSEG